MGSAARGKRLGGRLFATPIGTYAHDGRQLPFSEGVDIGASHNKGSHLTARRVFLN